MALPTELEPRPSPRIGICADADELPALPCRLHPHPRCLRPGNVAGASQGREEPSLQGQAEDGGEFQPDDPLADRLQPLARARDSREAAVTVLSQRSIFGDLADSVALLEQVTTALACLREQGRLRAAQSIGTSQDS